MSASPGWSILDGVGSLDQSKERQMKRPVVNITPSERVGRVLLGGIAVIFALIWLSSGRAATGT